MAPARRPNVNVKSESGRMYQCYVRLDGLRPGNFASKEACHIRVVSYSAKFPRVIIFVVLILVLYIDDVITCSTRGHWYFEYGKQKQLL